MIDLCEMALRGETHPDMQNYHSLQFWELSLAIRGRNMCKEPPCEASLWEEPLCEASLWEAFMCGGAHSTTGSRDISGMAEEAGVQ